MNPEENQVPWYGTSQDWSQIMSSGAQGAGNAMQGNAQYANSKREAREAKRRTLANLVNKSRKRDQDLLRSQQNYSGEMSDYKTQAMQQLARGFVEALQGTSG